MTVSSSVSSISYTGNGVTTVFAVPFYFLENAHLRVASNGTPLILNIGYTVTGAGDPAGGSITTTAAPATGVILEIDRNVPITQLTDYVENDFFSAETHERALDKLTMIAQQAREDIDVNFARSLRVPYGETVTELGNEAARVGKFIKFDTNGDPGLVSGAETIVDASDIGVAYVSTAADISNLTKNYSAVVLGSYWDSSKTPYPAGGGVLTRDPVSSTPVDSMVTFPAITGRYRRPVDTIFKASEAGLYSSFTADQSIRLQDFINICMNERWQALIDVFQINCDGADIWVNPDGTAFSSSSLLGRPFTMRGANRRDTQILNAYLTFGKFYRDVAGVRTFDITRDPMHTFDIQDIHVEGCTRFVNIEGCPYVANCGFFTTNTAGFYTTFPSNWGIGNGATQTITTPYTAITHVVELIACNHMQWVNNNVQNGNFYGLALSGAIGSQMGNLSVLGGRFNANNRALEFGAHPVYGISSSETVRIEGTHFESNTKEAIKLAGANQVYLNSHVRGSAADWDRANFPLVQVESALSRDINIAGLFAGVDSISGTAINVTGASGITIEGFFQRFKTIANLGAGADNYKIGRIAQLQIERGSEFIVNAGATPYKLPAAVKENVSPAGIYRGTVALYDDFTGATIDSRWLLQKGSDVDAVNFAPVAEAGGIIAATTGNDAGATMALNGVQISHGLSWQANKGGLSLEVSAKISNILTSALFIGLTDQNVALEMPATLTGAGVTPIATDCVGFLYDTNSDDPDIWKLVGVKNGLAVAINSVYAPVNNQSRTYRIDIDSTGIANFYRDGELLGISDLVTNGSFTVSTGWTLGANWTILLGTGDEAINAAEHTPGSVDTISQAVNVFEGQTYTLRWRIANRTVGSVTPSLTGGTPVPGITRTAGAFVEDLAAGAGNTTLTFTPSSDFNGRITDISLTLKGLGNAVTPTVPLTPVVAAFSRGAVLRTISIDHIHVQQNR